MCTRMCYSISLTADKGFLEIGCMGLLKDPLEIWQSENQDVNLAGFV